MKIEKFRHKGVRRLYENDDTRGVPSETVRKIRNILAALEFATDMSQLATLPGWRLHPLKGDRSGDYSISVTGNWRLTFRVTGRRVTDINFEDYH